MTRSGREPSAGATRARRGVMTRDVPSRTISESEREPRAGRSRAAADPPVSTPDVTPSEASSRSEPERKYTAVGELSAESMHAAHRFWADGQSTVSLCAFCDWRHEGTAAEGREAALAHRQEKHPEACIRKPRLRRRISKKNLRTAGEEEQIAVDAAEANRLRRERDEAAVLAKIERGRLRDAAAESALDEAAA